jgi:hypothetical protein
MPAYQVYSLDTKGKRHEERYTTNERLAFELVSDLTKEPDIQDAWYVVADNS